MRIPELEHPLCLLARVLCEDFFLIYWVSVSSQTASEYDKTAATEWAKLLRVNVKGKRARIVKTKTRVNVTQRYMPMLEALKAERKIWKIADELGLLKVYDMVYRFYSLYVHGNTFKFEHVNSQGNAPSALSAINALLKAILVVANHPHSAIKADEILTRLGLHNVGGK